MNKNQIKYFTHKIKNDNIKSILKYADKHFEYKKVYKNMIVYKTKNFYIPNYIRKYSNKFKLIFAIIDGYKYLYYSDNVENYYIYD